jgi:hypothetical protein
VPDLRQHKSGAFQAIAAGIVPGSPRMFPMSSQPGQAVVGSVTKDSEPLAWEFPGNKAEKYNRRIFIIFLS